MKKILPFLFCAVLAIGCGHPPTKKDLVHMGAVGMNHIWPEVIDALGNNGECPVNLQKESPYHRYSVETTCSYSGEKEAGKDCCLVAEIIDFENPVWLDQEGTFRIPRFDVEIPDQRKAGPLVGPFRLSSCYYKPDPDPDGSLKITVCGKANKSFCNEFGGFYWEGWGCFLTWESLHGN